MKLLKLSLYQKLFSKLWTSNVAKENKSWYLTYMIIYTCGSKVEFSWKISLAASTKERECTMYIPVYPNSSRSSRMRFLQRDGMTTKKGPPMKKFFGPYRKTFQQKWDSKSQKGDCHALEKSSAASSLDEVSVFRKKGAQKLLPLIKQMSGPQKNLYIYQQK